jgi:hypothetical protein
MTHSHHSITGANKYFALIVSKSYCDTYQAVIHFIARNIRQVCVTFILIQTEHNRPSKHPHLLPGPHLRKECDLGGFLL